MCKNTEVRKILRIGESLGLTLPFKWAILLGLRAGDEITMMLDGNTIHIKKRIRQDICPRCGNKSEKIVYDNSKDLKKTIEHLKKHADKNEEYRKALNYLLQHKEEKFIFYYCKKCSIFYVYSEEGNIYAMEVPLEYDKWPKREKTDVHKKFKSFVSECWLNYEVAQDNSVRFFILRDRLGKHFEQTIAPKLR